MAVFTATINPLKPANFFIISPAPGASHSPVDESEHIVRHIDKVRDLAARRKAFSMESNAHRAEISRRAKANPLPLPKSGRRSTADPFSPGSVYLIDEVVKECRRAKLPRRYAVIASWILCQSIKEGENEGAEKGVLLGHHFWRLVCDGPESMGTKKLVQILEKFGTVHKGYASVPTWNGVAVQEKSGRRTRKFCTSERPFFLALKSLFETGKQGVKSKEESGNPTKYKMSVDKGAYACIEIGDWFSDTHVQERITNDVKNYWLYLKSEFETLKNESPRIEHFEVPAGRWVKSAWFFKRMKWARLICAPTGTSQLLEANERFLSSAKFDWRAATEALPVLARRRAERKGEPFAKCLRVLGETIDSIREATRRGKMSECLLKKNRIYNRHVNCPGELLKFFAVDGEQVKFCDINAAHLAIALAMYSKDSERKRVNRMLDGRFQDAFCDLTAKFVRSELPDVERRLSETEALLKYETDPWGHRKAEFGRLASKLQQLRTFERMNSGQRKIQLLAQILYTKQTGYALLFDMVLAKYFPETHKRLTFVRDKRGPAELYRRVVDIEFSIIRATAVEAAEMPNVFPYLVSRHDAIGTTGDAECLNQMLQRNARKLIDLKVQSKVECSAS